MADAINISSIAKLTGDNYPQWKFVVDCALQAKGVNDVAKGITPKPAENVDNWNKQDGLAKYIISVTVDFKIIPLIEGCATAKDILDKLESIYGRKSEINKMLIYEEFYKYTMIKGDTMAEHISKIQNIAQRIKNAGDEVTDAAIITKILGSLPDSYANLRQAWFSVETNKQTLKNLTARLLDEENVLKQKINNEQPAESAFIAMPKNVTCYRCQKVGHYAKYCRAPRQEPNQQTCRPPRGFSGFRGRGRGGRGRNRGRGNNRNDQSNSNEDAFITETQKVDYTDENTWIMDSGAGKHMTFREDYFCEYNPLNDGTVVTVGNSQELPVKGKGTIKINKLVNGQWEAATLNNVLHVPNLRRNLFSEGEVTEKGMTIIKSGQSVVIKKNDRIVANGVKEKNNLYTMLFKTPINIPACSTVVKKPLKIWHERLGHINVEYLKRMVKKGLVTGVEFEDEKEFFCESCTFAKQHRKSFKRSDRQPVNPGDLIYTDICGPMSENSIGNARYVILFKDGATAYRTVFFINKKSNFLECLKIFNERIKNKFGHNLKILHSDNGTEICSKDVTMFLNEIGAERELTAPYTPEQNGRSEREFRTIMESARAMLFAKNLPKYLWAEAVNNAVYVLNRTPNTQVNTTPYEEWTGQIPKLDHIRTFGSNAYVHIPKTLRTKLEHKSKKMILVGYDEKTNNCRVFDQQDMKVHVSRDVIFDETNGEETKEIQKSQETKTNEYVEINVEEENEDTNDDQKQQENDVTAPAAPSTYSLRARDTIRRPHRYELNYVEVNEPQTYDEAMESEESEFWKLAMKEELESLRKNDTWEICKRPKNKNIVGSRWVFKVKDENNQMRFKARIVAKGYSQDIQETFSPTVRFDSVRTLLAVASKQKFQMKQFDVKTAFLNGMLDEEIYLEPPPGIIIPEGNIYKLRKALYGLKQASRCWNETFNKAMEDMKFVRSKADNCVYYGTVNEKLVLLALYVDDGLILSENKNSLKTVLKKLQERFEIKIMDVNNFCGLEIKKEEDDSIFIHQTKYIQKIVRKFLGNNSLSCEKIQKVKIPMDPGLWKNFNEEVQRNEEHEDQNKVQMKKRFPYREAIGSLMFAAIVSRPEIAYAVNMMSRFVEDFKEKHWKAVLRIYQYLATTVNYGILYKSNSDVLIGYSDADFAGDLSTRRSTSGYVFQLAGAPVTWSSRRQPTVALSTAEAEYIAAAGAAQEAVWLQQLLNEVGFKTECVELRVDNMSAINLINNPVQHKRTKHIDVKFHFIRELKMKNMIQISYVPSELQFADILTKPLPKIKFINIRDLLGMIKRN